MTQRERALRARRALVQGTARLHAGSRTEALRCFAAALDELDRIPAPKRKAKA